MKYKILDQKKQLNYTSPMSAETEILSRLRQEFTQAKKKNDQTSVRSFSKKLGLPASTISLVLLGKRKFSNRLALRLIEALPLQEIERTRLTQAIQNNKPQAATPPSDRGKRKPSVPKATEIKLSKQDYMLIRDWEHFAILSLINTNDFQYNASWIANRLTIKPERAAEAMRRLERLKLVRVNSEGQTQRTYQKIRTSDGPRDDSLRHSHLQSLELSKQKIQNLESHLRDITWATLPVDFSRFDEMKLSIRNFQEQFIQEYGLDSNATEVVRMNVQLFPLSNVQKETDHD